MLVCTNSFLAWLPNFEFISTSLPELEPSSLLHASLSPISNARPVLEADIRNVDSVSVCDGLSCLQAIWSGSRIISCKRLAMPDSYHKVHGDHSPRPFEYAFTVRGFILRPPEVSLNFTGIFSCIFGLIRGVFGGIPNLRRLECVNAFASPNSGYKSSERKKSSIQ